MRTGRSFTIVGLILLFGMAPVEGGLAADVQGNVPTRLGPCPRSPNCVSSLAGDARHAIRPLAYTGPLDDARQALQLISGGHVLMTIHAYAPGSGDPSNFRIGGCSTQRNLNDEGRVQARRIGLWLRERGIESARVYSESMVPVLRQMRPAWQKAG